MPLLKLGQEILQKRFHLLKVWISFALVLTTVWIFIALNLRIENGLNNLSSKVDRRRLRKIEAGENKINKNICVKY